MFTVHIFKTNDYPNYEHTTERFESEDQAYKRFNELSAELYNLCNEEKLQDFQLELRNR